MRAQPGPCNELWSDGAIPVHGLNKELPQADAVSWGQVWRVRGRSTMVELPS